MASAASVIQSSLGELEGNELAKKPIIAPNLPILSRLILGLRLWLFKASVSAALRALYTFKASDFKKVAPSLTKTYPVRPTLVNRVFIPASYNPKSGEKLALYLDIHGGGFALCDPQTDDRFCHHMANTYNLLIVSINYRKAPSYPFPIPVHDCAEIARAVLSDESLPIDHTRIAAGGFSAGGNLALAIAQLPGLVDKIHAVVPVYPVVDSSGTYRGTYRSNPKTGAPDMLKSSGALFDWGYINPGTDRTDSLLSPIYASRTQLPQKLFFIGAEYDVLCQEAEIMAKKLAGVPIDEAIGDEWSRSGVKWKMVRDAEHGFTHTIKKGEEEKERLKATMQCYRDIGEWLEGEAGFKR